MPAVLYTKSHPANKRYGDTSLLQLAKQIGDMLVSEYDKGHYTARGDNDWDTYIWLEAYRILENKLGEEREVHFFINQIQWCQISHNREKFHFVPTAIARLLCPHHNQYGKNLPSSGCLSAEAHSSMA
jgi:hypothetical protein